MQNQLTEQLNKLEKSVNDAINAPFLKKSDYVEQTVKESLHMCRLLVAENIKLTQQLEALNNGK